MRVVSGVACGGGELEFSRPDAHRADPSDHGDDPTGGESPAARDVQGERGRLYTHATRRPPLAGPDHRPPAGSDHRPRGLITGN